MLIYNYQKEFIGIDESSLKTLGFSNLAQLMSQTSDFADLFVKSPGLVHNFKHVHWIDFVSCAESNQESKVIINVDGTSFRCNLDIKGIYLKDDPQNMGYAINLVNLRAINQEEAQSVKKDIEQKTSTKSSASIDTLQEDYKQGQEALNSDHIDMDENDFEYDDTIMIDDFDTMQDDEVYDFKQEQKSSVEDAQKEPLEPLYNRVLEVRSDYVYDPQLACDELGLPLELIEEFIQDFIAQANEFKKDLYDSLNDQNIDNVKILSHKLKGVAANLRIEDAFEVLTTVNGSEDLLEIKQSLDMFYDIIHRLSKGSKPKETQEIKLDDSDDDFVLSFKDDEDKEVKKENPIQYNRVKAAKEIGIDIQNFDELFSDFIGEAKDYILKIKKAAQDNDFETSKTISIKFKRMCETMRIDGFDEELDSIENSKDIATITKDLASIQTKLDLMSSMEK